MSGTCKGSRHFFVGNQKKRRVILSVGDALHALPTFGCTPPSI